MLPLKDAPWSEEGGKGETGTAMTDVSRPTCADLWTPKSFISRFKNPKPASGLPHEPDDPSQRDVFPSDVPPPGVDETRGEGGEARGDWHVSLRTSACAHQSAHVSLLATFCARQYAHVAGEEIGEAYPGREREGGDRRGEGRVVFIFSHFSNWCRCSYAGSFQCKHKCVPTSLRAAEIVTIRT